MGIHPSGIGWSIQSPYDFLPPHPNMIITPADTGPTIAFARLGRLTLLRQVFEVVLIPDAVFTELMALGNNQPGAHEVRRAAWIETRTVVDRTTLAQMPHALHAGEREAILLAQEHTTQLLMDEKRGRALARARGIDVVRSLRVLAMAKSLNFIPAVHPLIIDLQRSGYWIDKQVVDDFLKEMGEVVD